MGINYKKLLYMAIKLMISYGLFCALEFLIKMLLSDKEKEVSFFLPKIKRRITIRKQKSDINAFNQVFILHHYHVPEIENAKVILDVGANIGLASLYLFFKYPDARIVGIEPHPENFNLLRKNITDIPAILARQQALASEKGKVGLVNENNSSTGYQFDFSNQTKPGNIEAVTIEQLLSENEFDCVDILKIDIEGSEQSVFNGLDPLIFNKIRNLIIEPHDNKVEGCTKAIFKSLTNYSYQCELKFDNLVFTKIQRLVQ